MPVNIVPIFGNGGSRPRKPKGRLIHISEIVCFAYALDFPEADPESEMTLVIEEDRAINFPPDLTEAQEVITTALCDQRARAVIVYIHKVMEKLNKPLPSSITMDGIAQVFTKAERDQVLRQQEEFQLDMDIAIHQSLLAALIKQVGILPQSLAMETATHNLAMVKKGMLDSDLAEAAIEHAEDALMTYLSDLNHVREGSSWIDIVPEPFLFQAVKNGFNSVLEKYGIIDPHRSPDGDGLKL